MRRSATPVRQSSKEGSGSEFGEVEIKLDTTDNDEGWIQSGGETGNMAKFLLQATDVPHTMAFEARVKASSITTGGWFVGFGEEGMSVADTIADGGTIVDKDYIGFFLPEVDSNGVDAVYNKASGANPTISVANIHTVVADTYVKLELIYNYKNSQAQQIKWYMNGVRNATYVTKTLVDNATNFPGDEEMALLFGGKNSSAAANTFTMDWWRAALVVNK